MMPKENAEEKAVGELVIGIALGAWISFGGWLAYRSLKKEYEGDSSVKEGAKK